MLIKISERSFITMTDAEREVLSTIQAIFEAIEDKDLDKLAEYYAQDDNVTAFLPASPFRLDGNQSIWGEMERYKDKPTVNRISIFQPQVQIYGDVAIATFYSTTELFVPDDPMSRRFHNARNTHVFHKRDEKWVLVHTHLSALP